MRCKIETVADGLGGFKFAVRFENSQGPSLQTAPLSVSPPPVAGSSSEAPAAVVPVPAPAPAVAPPAEVAAAGGSNGVWEPPRLLVRLVELPQMDQIAVRLAPTQTGDGKLDCDLKLAPVYDLLVTQVEATPK